jgi:hypothetical protein
MLAGIQIEGFEAHAVISTVNKSEIGGMYPINHLPKPKLSTRATSKQKRRGNCADARVCISLWAHDTAFIARRRQKSIALFGKKEKIFEVSSFYGRCHRPTLKGKLVKLYISILYAGLNACVWHLRLGHHHQRHLNSIYCS